MNLRQILPRNFPGYVLITTSCVCLAATISVVQTGTVAAAIFCVILTLLVFGGYCLIVHVTILNDRDRQRRESRWDEEAHQKEREEMLK